jgi:hypothetical protein
MMDPSVAEMSTCQHTTLTRDIDIHAPGGIRTRNSKSERLKTYALILAATGIGSCNVMTFKTSLSCGLIRLLLIFAEASQCVRISLGNYKGKAVPNNITPCLLPHAKDET